MSINYIKSSQVYNNLFNKCIKLSNHNNCVLYKRFLHLHCVSFSKK